MSLFADIIRKRSEEVVAFKPAVQSGRVLSTTDVVNTDLKNPYFLALNGRSQREGESLREAVLKLDPSKSGLSIGVKDLNGVTREELVFCSPKFTNEDIFGKSSGKVAGPDPVALTIADIAFSGTNNQLPTVLGMQEQTSRITDRVMSTNADAATTISTQPTVTAASTSYIQSSSKTPLGDSEEKIAKDRLKSGKITPDYIYSRSTNPLDSSSSPNVKDPLTTYRKALRDKTQRGPYGNAIRTGTVKVSSTEMAAMVDAMYNVNF